MIPEETIALRMEKVSKRYPGTLAVDAVDFEARAGEVHALMGENGAGKSTLMKMLAGSFHDYTGDIWIRGQKVHLHSPAQAKAAGIEMIYQELSLAQPLSIAENILAGRLPVRHGFLLDRRALVREAGIWMMRVGLTMDPLTPVEALSQHEQQLVEIAKALSSNPSILVMDEPTSALSRTEVERLFGLIHELKSRGLAVIYISHHLSEVFEVADRVTVMRDGRQIDTRPLSDMTPEKLVEQMVGRSVNETRIERLIEPGEVRFAAKNLTRLGFFHNVSFNIRRGEILGIGGLAGAGRTELARSICAIDPLDEGEMELDGRAIETTCLQDCLRRGLAYLTEDRKLQGLALEMNARDNTLSAANAKSRWMTGRAKANSVFQHFAQDLYLQPPDATRQASQFSGGNQQKILLAKWLATHPEVCILDEPTRGVDVGAKRIIHEAIGRLADQGRCVLLLSSDLPELIGLSNRILIMRKGHLTREIRRGETAFTEDGVLLAANAEGDR